VEFWENLDSVVSIGDHQVSFYFARRYPGMLFHTGIGIIPEHVFEGHTADKATLASHPTLVDPGGALVTSGPFKVAEWRRGERLVLVPNPGAFTSHPNLERVVFRAIPDETTRLIELRSGGVDVIDPAPVSAAEELSADPQFRIETVTQRFYDYIGWNPAKYPAFTEPELRLALSVAIDRRTILDGLDVAPYAEPASGPYPPIFRKLADSEVRPDPYMPDSARALLDAIGWRDDDGDGIRERDGQPLRFTLLTQAGLERRTSTAEIVQAQYAEVGVDMSIQEVEFNALLDIMFGERGFEAVLLGWRVGLEPDYVIGLFWPSDHTFNITGYSNAAVDSLIERAQAAPNGDQADRHWRAVARSIAKDRPYAFLWYFGELVGVNEHVEGTRINTFGVYQNLHQWWVSDG
jgi:peptide/nickel transport system substrate-binding protein